MSLFAFYVNYGISGPVRRPLDTQKYVGGDMSMMAFVQPAAAPARFAFPNEHHVKGLNAETLAKVQLPSPQWLSTPEYAPMLGDSEPLSPSIFFSLNISLYNQQIDASEWANQSFFMVGRFHPYALTWELEQRDGLESESDNIHQYTVPTLVVRDHSFQPVSPRLLHSSTAFPAIMPIVSFTGPVVGSGLDLLRADVAAAFDEPQLKCCGFVQLSTFVSPGKPEQTPFKGFHPFQVFVIFPVHANPWTSLCKKMAQRRDSQFQPGAPFTCTGKVAGLLAHKLMRHPPAFEQDYVFIVVPDTWTFLDKASFNQPPTTQVTPTTPKHPVSSASEYDNAMARFTSTKKRQRPSTDAVPATPNSLPPASASTPTKRPLLGPHETPTKGSRLSPAPSTIIAACDAGESFSEGSLDGADDDDASDEVLPEGNSATDQGSPEASTSDAARPHRIRQPPKKYQEAV
ncbi:hypothetical protein O9K51_09748 [Purpureocillium lavendulum]|uniref:Uncharacterized protein n=1 Tax=Purpureocillium lavendulum TaxID=1247861 RepID=A0AB34FER9_9HYPO|nr:hypothetical protein O9K51_09748 [Purpureocillium lavendulum]